MFRERDFHECGTILDVNTLIYTVSFLRATECEQFVQTSSADRPGTWEGFFFRFLLHPSSCWEVG